MPGTLIFHHNGVGDYLMSVPAMRALARFAPAPVHVVCGDGQAASFYEDAGADAILRTRTGYGHFVHRFDPDAVTGLCAPYEWFISLAHWFSPDILRLREVSGANWSAGLYPHFDLRPDADDRARVLHDIDRIFSLAAAFNPGMSVGDWAHALPLPAPSMELAASVKAGLPADCIALAVHAETRPEKVWPLDRLDSALAKVMQERPRVSPLILNTPPALLPRTAGNPAAKFLVGLPLAHAAAVTATADCFLGVDSCMLHVADLFRRPGVALFGPTDPAQYGYRFEPPLRPVHVRPTDRNLRRLAPDTVVRALIELLDQL
jgi:ADP-heptose:LPS heptosyltransferase